MTTQYGTIVYAPVVAGGDSLDDMPSAFGDQLGRTIHHFESEADKDTFTTTYLSRLYKSWAAVKQSDDGIVWYEWSGTKEDGSDGAWIELNGSSGDSSLVVQQNWGNNAQSTAVTAIQTLYPLEVNQNQIGGQADTVNAALSVSPRAYEAQHANSCLLKLNTMHMIGGQNPHSIYMAEQVVPTGAYYSLNAQAGGVDVQDNTGGDTAATGGQATEVLLHVAFLDTAPADGTISIWLEYKDPSDPIDKKILLDVRGNPLAVSQHFASDAKLTPLSIAGAFMAKATQPLKVMIETSWGVSEKIALDSLNTMICLNQFSNEYETSIARIEFQIRTGLQITPAIQVFTNTMLRLSDEIKLVSQPEVSITAGNGVNTLNNVGIENLTLVKVGIENATLTVKDAGNIADFYVNILLDNTHTQMLRGHEISSSIEIANTDKAFEFRAYQWTGKRDQVSQVYSSRNNGAEVLNAGWQLINSLFVAENTSGNFVNHTLTFDVPDTANNVIILIMPQAEQTPSTLQLQEFSWGVTENFTGYVEIERSHLDENALKFDETYAEFFLNNIGYSAIRYTINNTPSSGQPMPVGKLAKGKAPVEIDHTVNQISGSQNPQDEGAIKFLKDGEINISKSYLVWNEQGTDNTVTFWDILIDVDGNESKIPASETTFIIPKNTGSPGTTYTIPGYAHVVEAGQRIGGRATSNKADGAYVQSQSITEYIVQTVLSFDELVAVADAPDLVSVPFDKKLVTDRRVYTFTGNTLQNIMIDIDIPADVELANVDVVKHSGTMTTLVDASEFSYDSSTQKLTVHVGANVPEGKIYMTFWS